MLEIKFWQTKYNVVERTYGWKEWIKYINLIFTLSSKIAKMTKPIQDKNQNSNNKTQETAIIKLEFKK